MYKYILFDPPILTRLTQTEKFITRFGIPQHVVHDNGTDFISSISANWTSGLGITLTPRTADFPWKIPLKSNAEFKQQAGVIKDLYEHNDMNSWFVKPIIILPSKDYVKLVIDDHYLNSFTDTCNSNWPLEPLQVKITQVN